MDYIFYKDGNWSNNVLEFLINHGDQISIEEAMEEIRKKANEILDKEHTLYDTKLKRFMMEFERKLFELHKEVCKIVNNNEDIKPYLVKELVPEAENIFKAFLPPSHTVVTDDLFYHGHVDGDFWETNYPYYEYAGAFERKTKKVLTSRLCLDGSIFKDNKELFSDILIGVDKNDHFTVKTRDEKEKTNIPTEVLDSLFRDIENDKDLEWLYHEVVALYEDFYNYSMNVFAKSAIDKLKEFFNVKIPLKNGKFIEFDMETDFDSRGIDRSSRTGFDEEMGSSIIFSLERFGIKSSGIKVFYDYIPNTELFGLDKLVVPKENMGLKVYNENLELIDSFMLGEKIHLKNEKEVDGVDMRKPLLHYRIDKNALEVFSDNDIERDNSIKSNREIIEQIEKENAERERKQKIKELYQEKLDKSKAIMEKREKEEKEARNQIAESMDILEKMDKKVGKMKINPEILFYYNDDKCCYEIYPEYKGNLRNFDLSCIDFSNVNISGIDFRECNPTLLNPQTVYKKDLSNTNFSVNVDDLTEYDNEVHYVPSFSWDLTGVNLSHANLFYPEQTRGAERVLMPRNIEYATTDEATILPDSLKEKLNKQEIHNERKAKILKVLEENLKSGEISLEDLTSFVNNFDNTNENTGGKRL